MSGRNQSPTATEYRNAAGTANRIPIRRRAAAACPNCILYAKVLAHMLSILNALHASGAEMPFLKMLVQIFFLSMIGCTYSFASQEADGCYKIDMSPGILKVVYEGNVSYFSVPAMLEFSSEPSAGFVKDSGFMVARSIDKAFDGEEGGLWEIVEKRLSLRVGSDYSGVSMLLRKKGGGYSGAARPYMDMGPTEFTEGHVVIKKIPCER